MNDDDEHTLDEAWGCPMAPSLSGLPCTCGGTSEDICNLRSLGYTTEPEDDDG